MTDTTPAPSTDGAALLDEVEAFHRRFNIFPLDAAYIAVTLWDAHAHLLDCFDSTPRLAFLSPEPGSGKSRALEIVETLVPYPMVAVNASASALFRAVSGMDGRPTILFDEIDTVFGPKAGENEQLRGFLNAGHRRSGVMWRCVGDGANQQVQEFPSFCAVAVAGLGSLPDTILTRSVIVRMRRRAPNERVDPTGSASTRRKVTRCVTGSPTGPSPCATSSTACSRSSRKELPTGPQTYGSLCSPSPRQPAAPGRNEPAPRASSW